MAYKIEIATDIDIQKIKELLNLLLQQRDAAKDNEMAFRALNSEIQSVANSIQQSYSKLQAPTAQQKELFQASEQAFGATVNVAGAPSRLEIAAIAAAASAAGASAAALPPPPPKTKEELAQEEDQAAADDRYRRATLAAREQRGLQPDLATQPGLLGDALAGDAAAIAELNKVRISKDDVAATQETSGVSERPIVPAPTNEMELAALEKETDALQKRIAVARINGEATTEMESKLGQLRNALESSEANTIRESQAQAKAADEKRRQTQATLDHSNAVAEENKHLQAYFEHMQSLGSAAEGHRGGLEIFESGTAADIAERKKAIEELNSMAAPDPKNAGDVKALEEQEAHLKAVMALVPEGTEDYRTYSIELGKVQAALRGSATEGVKQATALALLIEKTEAAGGSARGYRAELERLNKQYGINVQTKGKYTAALQALEHQVPLVAKAHAFLANPMGQVGILLGALALGSRKAMHAFEEQENAMTNLDAALRNNGILTQGVRREYEELANTMGGKIGASSEQMLQVFTRLTKEGAKPEEMQKMTEAVINLAGVMGTNVEQAAGTFVRALHGNTRSLKMYGIEIDQHATKTQQFQQLMEQLAQKGEGVLEAQTKTLTGEFKRFGNATGEVLGNLFRATGTADALKFALTGLSTAYEGLAHLLPGVAEAQAELRAKDIASTQTLMEKIEAEEKHKEMLEDITAKTKEAAEAEKLYSKAIKDENDQNLALIRSKYKLAEIELEIEAKRRGWSPELTKAKKAALGEMQARQEEAERREGETGKRGKLTEKQTALEDEVRRLAELQAKAAEPSQRVKAAKAINPILAEKQADIAKINAEWQELFNARVDATVWGAAFTTEEERNAFMERETKTLEENRQVRLRNVEAHYDPILKKKESELRGQGVNVDIGTIGSTAMEENRAVKERAEHEKSIKASQEKIKSLSRERTEMDEQIKRRREIFEDEAKARMLNVARLYQEGMDEDRYNKLKQQEKVRRLTPKELAEKKSYESADAEVRRIAEEYRRLQQGGTLTLPAAKTKTFSLEELERPNTAPAQPQPTPSQLPPIPPARPPARPPAPAETLAPIPIPDVLPPGVVRPQVNVGAAVNAMTASADKAATAVQQGASGIAAASEAIIAGSRTVAGLMVTKMEALAENQNVLAKRIEAIKTDLA